MKSCLPKHRGAQTQEELCWPRRQKFVREKSPSLQVVPMAPVLVFVPRGLRLPCHLLPCTWFFCPSFLGREIITTSSQRPSPACPYRAWVPAVGSSVGWYRGGLCSWHTSSHDGAQSSLTIFSDERTQELPAYNTTSKSKLAKLSLNELQKSSLNQPAAYPTSRLQGPV